MITADTTMKITPRVSYSPASHFNLLAWLRITTIYVMNGGPQLPTGEHGSRLFHSARFTSPDKMIEQQSFGGRCVNKSGLV